MKEIILKATLLMAVALALPQVSAAQNVLGNLLGSNSLFAIISITFEELCLAFLVVHVYW